MEREEIAMTEGQSLEQCSCTGRRAWGLPHQGQGWPLLTAWTCLHWNSSADTGRLVTRCVGSLLKLSSNCSSFLSDIRNIIVKGQIEGEKRRREIIV